MIDTVTPNNLGQAVALGMGWDGSGQGQGGHNQWVDDLNPNKRYAYDTDLNAAENPNTMPALIEPLHQWEREGLTTSAAGMDTAGIQDASAQLQRLLGGSADSIYGEVMSGSGMIDRGVAGVTADEVAAIQNPYADSQKAQLSADAEKIRAVAMSSQGLRGGKSFGDTSTGIQEAQIKTDLLRGNADINYKTFQDALGQINTERNRYLTGASGKQAGANALTSGASVLIPGYEQQVDNQKYLAEQGLRDAERRTSSGQYVRKYNQGVNDAIQSDLTAEEGFDKQQLLDTIDFLKAYQSNTSSTSGGGANSLQQIGGALQAASGAGSKLFSSPPSVGGNPSLYASSGADTFSNDASYVPYSGSWG